MERQSFTCCFHRTLIAIAIIASYCIFPAYSSAPAEVSLRDHYTACEDLNPDFTLPYADHDARFYANSLRRWMVPDPKSEDYYGFSPYAYCAGNPVIKVDPYGKEWTDSDKAERLRHTVQKRIDYLEKKHNKLKAKQNLTKAQHNRLSETVLKIQYLKQAQSDIKLLGEDIKHTYSLIAVDPEGPHYVRDCRLSFSI